MVQAFFFKKKGVTYNIKIYLQMGSHYNISNQDDAFFFYAQSTD